MKFVSGAAASAIRRGVPAWYGFPESAVVNVLDPVPIATELVDVEL
jgi:hypothetical protein